MEQHKKGSLTDLNSLANNEAFYHTLSTLPPLVVRQFLRHVIASEVDGPLKDRIAAYQQRAEQVVPLTDRERWIQYLTYRMVPLIISLLYGNRSEWPAPFRIHGDSILRDAQQRYGRAVLVGCHMADYLTIPTTLSAQGIPIVVPMDGRIRELLRTLRKRWSPNLQIRGIAIPSPTASEEIHAAVNDGFWPMWFTDYWYDPSVPLTTANSLPLQIAQQHGWPMIPVTADEDGQGTYVTAVHGPLWTPKMSHATHNTMMAILQDWMVDTIEADPGLWWGWIVQNQLPLLTPTML